MPTIRLEANLSLDELIKAVQQLGPTEFEQFIAQVLVLRAERTAPNVITAETELLLKINRGLPAETQRRYNELIEKRQAETLSSSEHSELLKLSDEAEQLQAERLQHLVTLARLRKIPLKELAEQLGIRHLDYA